MSMPHVSCGVMWDGGKRFVRVSVNSCWVGLSPADARTLGRNIIQIADQVDPQTKTATEVGEVLDGTEVEGSAE